MAQSYKSTAYSSHHNVVAVVTRWKSKQFVLHVKNPVTESEYSIYTKHTVCVIVLVCHIICNARLLYAIITLFLCICFHSLELIAFHYLELIASQRSFL